MLLILPLGLEEKHFTEETLMFDLNAHSGYLKQKNKTYSEIYSHFHVTPLCEN